MAYGPAIRYQERSPWPIFCGRGGIQSIASSFVVVHRQRHNSRDLRDSGKHPKPIEPRLIQYEFVTTSPPGLPECGHWKDNGYSRVVERIEERKHHCCA